MGYYETGHGRCGRRKTVEVEGESSFRLKLKNFKIADATIVYVDDSTHMQFYTDKLNLKLSGDMSADMTDIDSKLSCKDIYFAMGSISYLKQVRSGKLTVSADLKNNKFILKENTLSLECHCPESRWLGSAPRRWGYGYGLKDKHF